MNALVCGLPKPKAFSWEEKNGEKASTNVKTRVFRYTKVSRFAFPPLRSDPSQRPRPSPFRTSVLQSRPSGRLTQRRPPAEFFYFLYYFFPIYQKYMPKLFFCKNVILPPVHPAEGRYRRMNRRHGTVVTFQRHCSDLPPNQPAVL